LLLRNSTRFQALPGDAMHEGNDRAPAAALHNVQDLPGQVSLKGGAEVVSDPPARTKGWPRQELGWHSSRFGQVARVKKVSEGHNRKTGGTKRK
jgi:hypothetical protein